MTNQPTNQPSGVDVEAIASMCAITVKAVLSHCSEFTDVSIYPTILEHITQATKAKDAEIDSLQQRIAELEAERSKLRHSIENNLPTLEDEPEYHSQAMGCGLEDRDIHDRYDAMAYGWECATERFGDPVYEAAEELRQALNPTPPEPKQGEPLDGCTMAYCPGCKRDFSTEDMVSRGDELYCGACAEPKQGDAEAGGGESEGGE